VAISWRSAHRKMMVRKTARAQRELVLIMNRRKPAGRDLEDVRDPFSSQSRGPHSLSKRILSSGGATNVVTSTTATIAAYVSVPTTGVPLRSSPVPSVA